MQRKDLEALQKELWALKGDVEVSFTKANKELANLQKDLSETRIQSGDHARGLAETKQQLGDTRQELAATQRSVTAVQKDASTTQGQLTLLQQEVSCNLSGAISGLQKDTLSLQSTTGEMRQEALKAQSFAKELEKDALAMQGRVNTLQQETSETKSVTAGLRQALEELQGTVRELQKGASQSQTHISDLRKEASDAQTHLTDLKKAILEAQNSTSELRRDLVKTQSHQTTEVRQEVEKTRSVAQELRKDLTLTFQLEVANVRKELCQKEKTLNGEIAAASARAKEQLSNEIRKVTNEVLQLTHGMRRAEEEAEELRAEVHEACTAIEENRQEVDAHLSLRISEVQQSLQAEFKVADANLHTEVATAAANDRYNLGVEMERLRGDLGQGGLLRSSVAQAQELASRAGAHEVIATLRVEQLFSPAPAACDYEFPLLASRCMVRLKPNRKGDMGSPSPIGRSPPRSGEVSPEYVGVFFGLCETRVALGNSASRLASYVCAVRVDVFDTQTSAWLTVLTNPAQELAAGGALLGSHEALTMYRFKDLATSGIGSERKLLLRVVVSDVGSLRLQQFEDTLPSPYTS